MFAGADLHDHFGHRQGAGFAVGAQGHQAVVLTHVCDGFVANQGLQVFVENFLLAIGQFLEALEGGIEGVFGVEFDVQGREALAQGVAPGQFAQGQFVGVPAHVFSAHDFVGFTVLQHAVLMDAGFVRKGVCANDGLVGLHRVAGHAGHQFGGRHDLRGVDAGVEVENVAAGFNRHDHFFQRGIPGALAQAVNRTFHLACAVQHRRQGVGDGQAQVVVAVSGPNHLVGIGHAGNQLPHALAPSGGNGIAHGVGHVEGLGPGLNHRVKNAHQKVHVRAHGVFGGEFHVVGVFPCPFHRLHGALNHLIWLHAQFVLHVDRAGGDKSVDTPGFGGGNGFPGATHVVFAGTRQGAHGGILDGFGHGAHSGKIAGAGGGKTGLNHVHAQLFQLARHADFGFAGHGRAGTLFPVAQSGVKNNQLVGGHGKTPEKSNQQHEPAKVRQTYSRGKGRI